MKPPEKQRSTQEITLLARLVAPLVTYALVAVAPLAASAEGKDPYQPKRVRILHQNIFGRDKNDCASRYQAIAKEIRKARPRFDIVSINELWVAPLDIGSCPQKHFVDELMKDPSWRDFNGIVRSIKQLPRMNEQGDFYNVDGGNAIFTRHRIVDATQGEFPDINNLAIPGYGMAKVKVDDDLSINVWTTHLDAGSDGCDDDCRWSQLSDLSLGMSGASDGEPVLLLGDFNIGGPADQAEKDRYLKAPKKNPVAGNTGYDHIVDDLHNPRDLWLEAHPTREKGVEPWTMDCKTNMLLRSNDRCEDQERIDYAFLLENKNYVTNRKYDVKVISVSRVEWKTPAGQNVSDHYGLDITLEITKRKTPAEPQLTEDQKRPPKARKRAKPFNWPKYKVVDKNPYKK